MSVQEKGVGENIVIVDATSQILGRLASRVAKLLLEGKKVIVVNVEKAVVSGDPVMVIEAYKKLFNVSNFRDLEKQGIRRPRNPIN
ncbi:MAG: uL13 family ribosomal protein [Fervidicoccaceae archaeon]